MTTAVSVCRVRRTFTNWPGQSVRASFGNRAFSSTVAVEGSTWLSTIDNTPSPSASPVSWLNASAASGVRKPSDTWARCWKSPCGTVKVTAIGVIWLTLTMPVVSEVLTTLPGSIIRTPTRPSIGDTIRQ